MKRFCLPIFCGTILSLSAQAAFAASDPATASFTVTITILKQCTVTTPANIVLPSSGAIDAIGATISGTTTFNVTCSNGTGYTISFAGQDDLAGTPSTHQMKGAATGNTDVVQYNLFDTTTGATNTTALSTTSVITGTGTGAAQSKTLQAKVINYTTPVTPDTYTDTVTMSVTY
ncbi:Csu type fimbrial protein [Methylovirgula sp. 4M-Z18]|uniref:Csu type fimbrial protein n=1 Tax=Methylovirgula sp. 4M-Z18 TaxID=2293567 RepID=UPI001AECE570|nr:spore coat protein U domain-containing protein [Methylovirgula sp. 4M-Z18]